MVKCEFFEDPIEHGEDTEVIKYWKIYAYCKKNETYTDKGTCLKCKRENRPKQKALW